MLRTTEDQGLIQGLQVMLGTVTAEVDIASGHHRFIDKKQQKHLQRPGPATHLCRCSLVHIHPQRLGTYGFENSQTGKQAGTQTELRQTQTHRDPHTHSHPHTPTPPPL